MSPLSGMKIGSSNMYQNRAATLWSAISTDDREFHGGGSRYNEKADGSDSLVGHCFDKLPASARASADALAEAGSLSKQCPTSESEPSAFSLYLEPPPWNS